MLASDSDSTTSEREALEFNLDEGPEPLGVTQEITPRQGGGTVEMPTLELPSSETPTVETPTLRLRGDDKRTGGQQSGGISPDATAEMAIDDLGLDVGDYDGESGRDDDATVQATQVDEATRIAPRDESTRMMPKSGAGADAGTDATGIARMSDSDRTSLLESMDFSASAGIDLDVGSAAGTADEPTMASTARLSTEQLPQLSDLEPVTMSEVGTKLDLARAYMDMGDPDGARNILQEVLAEGSASQKQEARRLIDSLPGA